MNFIQLQQNFKNVVDNFDRITVEVISQYEAELLDLNTSQLEIGETSEGKPIEPKYRKIEYAKYKKSIGSKAPSGIPDLKLEGDFYSGFLAKVTEKYIFIDSTDSKRDMLLNKYGNIFGLTEDNKEKFSEIIKETLKENIYDELTK